MSRLSREDWAKAALVVISDRGVTSLAIEPLAAELGATKGSFYWHFSAREELVRAALDLWEVRSTTAVIEHVEAIGGSPQDRLRTLFGLVFDPDALTSADVALVSHSDEPGVGAAVERMTARRIDYIAKLLRQTGASPAAARRRALFAYSAFLGHLHLRRHAPEIVSSHAGPSTRYLDEILRTLLTEPIAAGTNRLTSG